MNADTTIYLTRGMIAAATIHQRKIYDSYDWHQLAWKAFQGKDGAPRDFLTRLDAKDQGMQILMISPEVPIKPDWLADSDLWETKPIPQQFFHAGTYGFQLRANPTVKRVVRNQDGTRRKNGKRQAITNHAELIAWLERKGADGGFRLIDPESLEVEKEYHEFTKKSANGAAQKGVHGTVHFRGLLEITDLPLFYQTTFRNGIGSAKAFGYGLLCLAPQHS